MKTFILMWNPAISNYKMEDFRNCLTHLTSYGWDDEEEDTEYLDMNWSVWDHEKAEEGDRFFMVRVGEGNTGIVMSGTFCSDAYECDDWSGKGRRTFYMNLDCTTVVDSEKAPYISTEYLMSRLPGFDWTGGHSGRLLDAALAEQLEVMWLEYIYNHESIFDDERAACTELGTQGVNEILNEYLKKTRGNVCEICGYDYKKVWGEGCDCENAYRLYWPNRQQRAEAGDNLWKHIHCTCMSCDSVADEQLCARLGESVLDIYID